MVTVDVNEAKTRLSELLSRVEGGEEIVITRTGKPVARLVPVDPPRGTRVLGAAKGLFQVPDDFDAPLPEEILRAFEGEES